MNGQDVPASHSAARLLRNRNFILLWAAYGVSAMGDHLSEMAILKTLDAASKDVDITPLNARISFMFFLPFFLLGPFAGVLADRLPRRGLMIAADVVRCVIMFGFAGLIAWTRGWGTWGAFMPLALVGVFAAVFSPALSALLPTLIRTDQLVRANALISGLGIIATMLANLIGGYLAKHYDPMVAFRLDAGTFFFSAICLLAIRPPPQHGGSRAGSSVRAAVDELAQGVRYIRAHRHVVELLGIAALIWFCGPLVNSVIPAIARDVYHGDYQTMSSYRALIGLGFVIGSLILTVLGDALRGEIAITWGLVGISLGTGVFAASTLLPLSAETLAAVGAVGVVISGACAVAVIAGFNSLLQRTVADRFRGRVFGINDLCSIAALLTATAALGLPQWTRVDRWVGAILAAVAVVTLGAGVLTLGVRLKRIGPHGAGFYFGGHLNEFWARFWWRFRRVGRSTIPREGAVIIAANHTCTADPMLLYASAPYRPISFMVAEEFTHWPIISRLMRWMECIPVTRGGQDTAAFKKAVRHLNAGKALGIFIEGRIIPPGETPHPRDGAAMLALTTGAKVIPAYISGTIYREGICRGLLGRHRARVRLGPPVDLSDLLGRRKDREAIRTATETIYTAIQRLSSQDHESH